MDIHKNARLTLVLRAELVAVVLQQGLTLKRAAARFNVSPRTAGKWVRRYRERGADALVDRSSRPSRLRAATSEEQVLRVRELRMERLTGVEIGRRTGLSRATVSRILTRSRLNKLRMLEPAEPVVRYELATPGELVHFDIKKLARIVKPGHRITGDPRNETRGAGWEYLFVAIDDHSRLACIGVYPNERASSSIDFLRRANAWFARLHIPVSGVLTDNGPCFYKKQFGGACQQLNIRHQRTRPYRPQTNGKAERFIQTLLREWAYARRYENSQQRLQHLGPWLHHYNCHRPHASLNQRPPSSRIGTEGNNLLRHDI